jgi:Ca-activated chloride channel family protein
MTEPTNGKHDDSADLETIEDRLCDRALQELFGERPPDLSNRILAAAEEQELFKSTTTGATSGDEVMKATATRQSKAPRRSWKFFLATTACLLVACAVYGAFEIFVPGAIRESARRSDEDDAYTGSKHYAPSLAPAAGGDSRAATRDWKSSEPLFQANLDFETEAQFEPPLIPAIDDEGRGPGKGGDQYARIIENPFAKVADHPLSTFSIDVDTASYANVRQFLLQSGTLPPPDAVRIEELVNYFDYDYAGPQGDEPFATHIEVANCPWRPEHRLARIAIQGKEIDRRARPLSNLVFLIDVSGSMQNSNKLPLLKRGMKLLAEQLGENDRVAIVVYASAEGLALPTTYGSESRKIMAALENLAAGGSTNGGAGIELAYKVAQQNFIQGGVNRVILCTDGDFNVGTTSPAALERLAEEKAKTGVFLTVLGFGRGNLNDAMMESISNKGNGNYAYIDGLTEARKVLVEQMSGTLVTIAKDVKIQIEFNPAQVAAYRLIGYENRRLADEDFKDDTKDAGEIGAGHSVTALYELVPAGKKVNGGQIDDLKYQQPNKPTDAASSGELLTLKLRYKKPDGDKSIPLEFSVKDDDKKFGQASQDFRFASSVAAFGMLLRGSKYSGSATMEAVLEIANANRGQDEHGYRAEFVEIVREAKRLK